MRREAGMTLVEVMISAVVLSMVMLALSASLRTFATTYTAVEQTAERTARLREVTYFLRHVLREAYSPHEGAFYVSDNEISWLAPIDRAGAAGGVTWLRLRRAGDTLVLDFAIPDTETAGKARTDPAWGDAIPSEVLLEGVKHFQVKAIAETNRNRNGYDDNNEEPNGKLPPGVQVEWELDDMRWPPLVVALDGYEMMQ